MEKFTKHFGYNAVHVYKDNNTWNLMYSILGDTTVKNPSKKDIEYLDELYSNLNKTRVLVSALTGWVEQYQKGFISEEDFKQKMNLYFDD